MAVCSWVSVAAEQKRGYYEIFDVNPCRTPQVVEVVDIQPVPGSCVQESNAQTGELQFLHGGAWGQCQPGSGPQGQPRRGRSLPGCDQSTPSQSRTVLQHAMLR
jgi:hypothetical protein